MSKQKLKHHMCRRIRTIYSEIEKGGRQVHQTNIPWRQWRQEQRQIAGHKYAQ